MKMKQLVYRLTNGTVVRTLREALISGQGYRAEYIAVVKPTVMSDKRKELLAENGYIKPPKRLTKW